MIFFQNQVQIRETLDNGSRKQVNDLYTNILQFHLLQTRPKRLSARNNLSAKYSYQGTDQL